MVHPSVRSWLKPRTRPAGRRVFICYRRGDTAGYAEAIYESLKRRLGRSRVFLDKNSIVVATNFVSRIEQELRGADTVLVIIGQTWSAPENLERLRDPDDYVRREILIALQRGARLIPVFVSQASPPRVRDLPAEIQPMTKHNGVHVSGVDDEQMRRLLSVIVDQRPGILVYALTFGIAGLVGALLSRGFLTASKEVLIPGTGSQNAQMLSQGLTPWLQSPIASILRDAPVLFATALIASPAVPWSLQRGLLAALAATLGSGIAALCGYAIVSSVQPDGWLLDVYWGVTAALRFGLMALAALLVLRTATPVADLSNRFIARIVLCVTAFSFVAGTINRSLLQIPPDTIFLPVEALYYPIVLTGIVVGLAELLGYGWHKLLRISLCLVLAVYLADLVSNFLRISSVDGDTRYMIAKTLVFTLLGGAFAFALRSKREAAPPVAASIADSAPAGDMHISS